MSKNNNRKVSELYKTYIKTSAVGLEFGLSIGLCMLIGYWIDKKFSMYPWGLIIGVIIGFTAGVKRLWVFSKSYLKKNNHDKK